MPPDPAANLVPTEPALTGNDESFRVLVENINDVIWIRSADLRHLHYVSPAFAQVWGRPVSVLHDHPERWLEYVLPADQERVRSAFAAFVEKDEPLDVEYHIVRPDGEVRWVRVRGLKVRDRAGRPDRLVGIVSDLTDTRRAELALRDSEAQMRLRTTALDAAANAVFITNAEGMIQWANVAFTRLTGYAASEVIGRNPRMLKSGQHQDELYADLWRTILRGEVWHGELVNRRKNGELYFEDMTVTPVRDDGGAIAHFIAIKQDITERKRTEASLRDLHKKLVIASRQAGKADVAIDILHNVGNVLNSINVSVDLLDDQLRRSRGGALAKLGDVLDRNAADLPRFLTADPLGQKVPEYVRVLGAALTAEHAAMTGELAQLREHIRNIIDIVDRQRALASSPIATETIALAELVDDVLREGDRPGQPRELVIVRDDRANPIVTTDRHKVAGVLNHLMRNAVRACTGSPSAEKRIVVGITRDTDWARIVVSDNGVGIAPERLTEIFRPDYPRGPGGVGSGLHADATAATELGGKLTVQSDGPGRGATFTLHLPCPPA